MIKTGYDAQLSAGAITAGGALGILIPPSVMLIVMGPVLGVSVADLYSAAFGPGFLLAGIYIVYLIVRSSINPKLGPPVPKADRVTDIGAHDVIDYKSANFVEELRPGTRLRSWAKTADLRRRPFSREGDLPHVRFERGEPEKLVIIGRAAFTPTEPFAIGIEVVSQTPPRTLANRDCLLSAPA
jgi:TRAP-type mannitol/chloroaromatic compound transport system permease large subunit